MAIKIGLVGVGKIARDQHIPVLNQHSSFELAAVASRNAELEGVDCYRSLNDMLDSRSDIEAVALCMPPQARYHIALQAIACGKHVLLEKPPGTTLSEVDTLARQAAHAGVTLYNSWHSRHAAAAETARTLLQNARIESVDIQWLEDVRQWHPGQDWIWEAGGMGVFDPGINALSIVTHILPCDFHLNSARLSFPENKQAPIAAELAFQCTNGASMQARFDWRQQGPQFWNIEIKSSAGTLLLEEGGSRLLIDGEEQDLGPHDEYKGVYDLFYSLIENKASNTDCRPLTHAADAFMLGERVMVDAFLEE